MPLDAVLLRKVLLKIDEVESGVLHGQMMLEGYSTEQINYHISNLLEHGLLEALPIKNQSSPVPVKFTWVRLTFDGHECLSAARSETVWQKAKKEIEESGRPLSVGVFVQIISAIAKQCMGLS